MITFKDFLFDVQTEPTKVNPRISDEDFSVIIDTAKEMIRGKFANNYLEMVKRNVYIVRGDYTIGEKIGTEMEKTGKLSIGIVHPVRKTDRKSTFGGNQFVFSIWHLFNMPSRMRCIMGTLDSKMANNFGTVFILVPKEGTKMHLINGDWNLTFADPIEIVFGSFLTLGRLSHVFNAFTQLYGSRKYTDLFKELNQPIKKIEINVLEDMCEELDLLLNNTSIEEGFEKVIEETQVKRLMKFIARSVQDGETTFDLFKKFFTLIEKEIIQTTNISDILSSDNKTVEIWWTGNSFALQYKNNEELQELNHVLKHYLHKRLTK